MHPTQIEKIPAAVISIISEIYQSRYTRKRLENLFLTASAPEEIPSGNKYDMITDWLRLINQKSPNPLKVLGILLEDFLERDAIPNSYFDEGYSIEKLREEQEKIKGTLLQSGLNYSNDGSISINEGAISIKLSLQERILKQGLSTIEQESKRALNTLSSDPRAAILYAGNMLESSIKAYLDRNNVIYKEKDTLSDVWNKFVEYLGINPKNFDDNGLKQISSGLFQIVHGTMYLRNKKSAAHGKSEVQLQEIYIKPRHARLVVNSAHTLASYIVELIENSIPE